MLQWFDMTVEFVREERITVAAGSFDTRHYLVHLGASYDEPLEIWTHGPDHVIVLESWSVLGSRYELLEYAAD